jgi:prepilin-type N-terminal cleavage/methylation domain-containing protein
MNTLKQPQPPIPSTQSGFTLIECLIAIIIVSVLMVAIAPAVVISTATRLQARRVELATQSARAYVDGVRSGSIPPPQNVIYFKNQSKDDLLDKSLFTSAGVPTGGAAGWSCTPGYVTQPVAPTLANAAQYYCPDGNSTWQLYCVDLDGNGCSSTSPKDLVIQSFRSITVPSSLPTKNYYDQAPKDPAEANKGYFLGIRVYRADALKDSGALRTSVVDAQNRTSRRQLTHTAGVGDSKSPLVELTTEIGPAAQSNDPSGRWKSLCSRLGGCTTPTPTVSPSL